MQRYTDVSKVSPAIVYELVGPNGAHQAPPDTKNLLEGVALSCIIPTCRQPNYLRIGSGKPRPLPPPCFTIYPCSTSSWRELALLYKVPTSLDLKSSSSPERWVNCGGGCRRCTMSKLVLTPPPPASHTPTYICRHGWWTWMNTGVML